MTAASGHVEDRLVSLVRGELELAEQAQVEGHLATCGACRAVRADFDRLAGDLARLDVPPVSWPAYRVELRDKLAHRETSTTGGWSWSLRPLPVAMAAGLVAMLLYAGGASLPGRGPGQGDLAAIENTLLASRLDLISRLDLMQRLDLFEDFDVIHRLDSLPGRSKG
ncbi:MAG TPA: zf-HC2 domain-containing protein [Candidatus Limnocylindrales bacterium]|nr:zf-HC2 domain-containing protein [Candidatus Limnocylindrales bacterium]